MGEVTLQEMLDARDHRAGSQRQLLETHKRPVLSYTMNIPGPVKDSPLIHRGFTIGLNELKNALARANIPMLSPKETRSVTGCEFLCAVDADAETVKALCRIIEDASPMGRLFDMDVIDTNGCKLERPKERYCLVCRRTGRGCASRRLHGLDELNDAVIRLLQEGLMEADAGSVEALVTDALREEVRTTPKPGLVDMRNNGAHADMSIETFQKSADALKGYWSDCFRIGVCYAEEPPEKCFFRLRERGRKAEEDMYLATCGVNTHKGAIFLLGTVCGAIGRLWRPHEPCRAPDMIARECAMLCHKAVADDFALLEKQGIARSAGEQLYLESGCRGARGELAEGLPGVIECALPAFEDALASGISRNDAGATALVHLIARGGDSNMIKRGGAERARQACADAAALLPLPARTEMEALDDSFIEQNLSPGGCADLLAICYFLHDWKIGRITLPEAEETDRI